MRNVKVLILGLVAVVASSFTTAPHDQQKSVAVTVSWSFTGIEEGYDHKTKTELYIDGKLVATSSVTNQSEPNNVSAKTTKGVHDVKVINYAQYDGEWEAHTIENNFSIDCTYQETLNLKKRSNEIILVFNLDVGTSRVK